MAAARQRWPLLVATALLSPAVFLAVFELLLRVVGFGGHHPLFVPVPDRPDLLQANPEVMRRYFPGRAPREAPEPIPFAAEKPAGSTRIVVQGGSTAAGFPYGRWAGLAGMLGDRLEATFPDRQIEVITTAMAAVNSYTLLDFVDEIVAVEPDLVLIYAGHNEYMGVLGVSSGLTTRRSREATLLHLHLRRFRVYQYLQALVAAGRQALLAPGTSAGARTLMAHAARGVEIDHDSEVYRAGRDQWEANLRAILSAYRDAGIPVRLGTPVSNEKDQPPFASDPNDAEGAAAWYARGQRALESGDAHAARLAFREARDRDRLPFRAPGEFVDVVRRVAAETGARVVEVQAQFAAASPHGIVGRELMLEHVHPNADGYFLLAHAFYETLRAEGAIDDWSRAPSLASARNDMPITQVDRLVGEYALLDLRADFPFRTEPVPVQYPAPRDEVERIALALHRGESTWLESMERLLQIHQARGESGAACRVARLAAQAFPNAQAPNYAAGVLLLEQGESSRARRYLERSRRADPSHVPTQRALARAQ